MKIKQLTICSIGAIALSACSSDDPVSLSPDAKSVVNVQLNAGVGSDGLLYPITLYAYDNDGTEAAKTVLQSEADKPSLTLKKGAYTVAAVSGSADFSSGSSTTPLAMGKQEVVIKSTDVDVNVSLEYAVASVDFTLTQIPEDVTGLSVSISPLYGSISSMGVLSGTSSATFQCTKTATPGVWKSNTAYVLPGTGDNTAITITVTDDEGTNTYSAVYSSVIKAATPYHFSGTYNYVIPQASAKFSLSMGNWNTVMNPTFTFTNAGSLTPGGDTPGTDTPGGSESGTEDADGIVVYTVSKIPAAGEMFNGHLVVWEEDGEAMFLSLTNVTGVKPANAAAKAAEYSEGELTGWMVPTSMQIGDIKARWKQMPVLSQIIVAAGGTAISGKYNLCDDGGSIFQWTSSGFSTPNSSGTYYLRFVKDVRFVLK